MSDGSHEPGKLPWKSNWRYGLGIGGFLLGTTGVPALLILTYPSGGYFDFLPEYRDLCLGGLVGGFFGGASGFFVGLAIDYPTGEG